MFICRTCEEVKTEYARGAARSFGPCELCNQTADCLDARDYKVKATDKDWWPEGSALEAALNKKS